MLSYIYFKAINCFRYHKNIFGRPRQGTKSKIFAVQLKKLKIKGSQLSVTTVSTFPIPSTPVPLTEVTNMPVIPKTRTSIGDKIRNMLRFYSAHQSRLS